MKILYCPWRDKYSESVSGDKNIQVTEDACVFCVKFKDNRDDDHFIIKRFKHCVAIMNLYPYNAGHLLIIPFKHIACLSELNNEERNELMWALSISSDILKESLGAQGINIGLNLDRAAGAGIPSHLHVHIVPRWSGDTNFMPIIAGTKTISFDMNEIYAKLSAAFNQMI